MNDLIAELQAENERLKRQFEDATFDWALTEQYKARAEKAEADRDRLQKMVEAAIPLIARHPKQCKYGSGCNFISAVTGRPDCYGCEEWEWIGEARFAEGGKVYHPCDCEIGVNYRVCPNCTEENKPCQWDKSMREA